MSHSGSSEEALSPGPDRPPLRSNWRWSTAKPPMESDSDKLKKAARAQRFGNSVQTGKEQPYCYGFVSRGSEGLLQHSEQAQREYFDAILENFKASRTEKHNLKWSSKPETRADDAGLTSLLTNLRKLREALLHKPPDDFTKKVHLFSLRVSSAIGHFETYIPSINYLTHEARSLLTSAEHREIMTLRVLHLAHKNGANNRALETFFEHLDPQKDSRVFSTLVSWLLGDYSLWMLMYNSESDHAIHCAMSLGLSQMMKHMIDCFSKSFFTYRYDDFMKFLPRGMSWEDFRSEYSTPWTVEDNIITVRRRNK